MVLGALGLVVGEGWNARPGPPGNRTIRAGSDHAEPLLTRLRDSARERLGDDEPETFRLGNNAGALGP